MTGRPVESRVVSPPGRRQSPRRLWKVDPRRGTLDVLFRVSAFFAILFVMSGAVGATDPESGFAPAHLAGKQFTLEGLDSEGISEDVTVVFREGRRFDATRSVGEGALDEDSGSYAYRRTGPYTGRLTLGAGDGGPEGCPTYLTFTSATAGAYTGVCGNGVRRTGTFQVTLQDPFCISLWDGLPCATAANLPHLTLGPAAANTATAEVIIANSDPNPSVCEVALLFHQGTSTAPAVSFNGRPADRNLYQTAIRREGAEVVTLTAPDARELVTGAVYVYARSPCTAASLQVQGRYLIENRAEGTIEELFSVAGQSPRDWLGDGDCRVLTGVFGNGRNLGFASVAAQPGRAAPAGTRFNFRSFDLDGDFVDNPSSLSISGAQTLFWPWRFSEPRIIEMCLDVAGASNFQAAIIPIGSKSTGSRMQVAAESFADAFKVGDATAWGPR